MKRPTNAHSGMSANAVFYFEPGILSNDARLDKLLQRLGYSRRMSIDETVNYIVTRGNNYIEGGRYSSSIKAKVVTWEWVQIQLKRDYEISKHHNNKLPLGDRNARSITKSSTKGIITKLKAPYLIIEDIHNKNSPYFKEYTGEIKQIPILYLGSYNNNCPFIKPPTTSQSQISQKQYTIGASLTQQPINKNYISNNNKRSNTKLENLPSGFPPIVMAPNILKKDRNKKLKPGFCENCSIKYDCMDIHIKSTKHRIYAKNNHNFLKLDSFIDNIKRRLISRDKIDNQYSINLNEKIDSIDNKYSINLKENNSPTLNRKRTNISK
eukprot:GHVP01054414.1.p1 GENE.GHVP01054414.1~~GHVP01054414.1.p1  ORF type:complete len:324 (+),score=35.24 GHVP01054414.1:8-979(+)